MAITSDSKQWMVASPKMRVDKKTGEKYMAWEAFEYYSTMQGAAKACGEILLRNGDSTTMEELKASADAIAARLQQKLGLTIEVK